VAPGPREKLRVQLRSIARPFESECLGGPVARLVVERRIVESEFYRGLLKLVRRWRDEGTWLVSCRIPAAWRFEADALVGAGFRPIEELITFRRPIEPVPESDMPVTLARPDDADACIEIGRTAFVHDRFHADPEIDDADANTLKAAWVRNSLVGRADASLVVSDGNRACGFVLCMRNGEDAVIDLIAVAPGCQGRGYGRALVAGALAHYAGKAATMKVGTQAENRVSVELYRRVGFCVGCTARTFHWVNKYAPT